MQLLTGEDILHLALARGHFNIAHEILKFHPQDPNDDLVGNIDNEGNSHLMILMYFPLSNETYYLIS